MTASTAPHGTRERPAHAARRPRHHLLAQLIGAALLGGCASFSTDGGFAPVEQTARDRLGKELRWAKTQADQDSIDQRVGELLSKPLGVDDAVQLALLNNRGLQASFQELGITIAAEYQVAPRTVVSWVEKARSRGILG